MAYAPGRLSTNGWMRIISPLPGRGYPSNNMPVGVLSFAEKAVMVACPSPSGYVRERAERTTEKKMERRVQTINEKYMTESRRHGVGRSSVILATIL